MDISFSFNLLFPGENAMGKSILDISFEIAKLFEVVFVLPDS